MTLFHLFILAIVQGITEFLPISSSAHLVLLHEIGGPSGNALALDVAVHLGSIMAVVLYFWPDVCRAFGGLGQLVRGRPQGPGAPMALALMVTALPAVLVGVVLMATGWVDLLRSTIVIGWSMIVFGVLLYLVHRLAPESRAAESWGLRDAVIMGVLQAVALVPGVSRSGITMTAGRMLGFERHAATRIALLMSIPITLATGGVLLLKALQGPLEAGLLRDAALASVLAFGAAYVALALMMRFLDRVSFTPYVIYRIILGIVLLALAYS